MLSVEEALAAVLRHAQPLPPGSVALEDSLGCVLAEPIASDVDSPPHDKSIVDGYAAMAAAIDRSGIELVMVEQIIAGAVPTRAVERQTAAQIMTGAPLPAGADAVVMVEQTQATGDRVRILQTAVKSGQNIMRRATSLAKGQAVLEPGTILRAIEIGLLAEVGRPKVAVVPRPRVAVLATGNELVPAELVPAPGQIRNSNGPLLCGLIAQVGARGVDLGIARDELADLRRNIEIGLTHDVLLLSGGVSAGVLDLVPQVLTDLGVQQVFHKVNLKPGKPLWFGVHRQTLVFGLPGNPVSALVCFELFVRPALEKISGRQPAGLPRAKATLAQDHQHRGDRPTYWPAFLSRVAVGGAADHGVVGVAGSAAVVRSATHSYPDIAGCVTPLPWRGSGDLRTLTDANCLIHFPAGDRVFAADDEVSVFLLDQP